MRFRDLERYFQSIVRTTGRLDTTLELNGEMSLMREAGGSLEPVPLQQLYAVRRVAQNLNRSGRLVYQRVQEGELEALRIGRAGIRIPEISLQKKLEANKVDPESKDRVETDRGQSRKHPLPQQFHCLRSRNFLRFIPSSEDVQMI